MTDRELMQQALDLLSNAHVSTALVWPRNDLCEALRARLAQPEPEPAAWRTFDGEGGYEYRSYELNEGYGAEWLKRNPNHKGWVELLYADPTPCQTCEALARTVMMDQASYDTYVKAKG